jgi:multicomponent Na+:H+ antiporter subunit E
MNVRRLLGIEAALVVMWVLAWGDLSVANVVSGALISGALLVVFPVARLPVGAGHTVRPLAALRLLVAFGFELLVSNLAMARDVLLGQKRLRTGILACPLRVDSDGVATFLTNLLSLTPGAMPIEVTHGPPVIYVHVLRMHDRDRLLANVRRFETLIVRAFGSPAELAACGEVEG